MTVKSRMYRCIKRWAKYLLALLFHYSGFNYLYLKTCKRHYILMLHRITDEADVLNISLNLPNLAQSIRWCSELGEITSMDKIVGVKTPALRFAFTFDDGYASVENILHLPQQVPVAVYLSTGFIDIKRRFWATSIESLLLDARVTNLNLSDLGLGEFVLSDMVSRRHAITNLNCLLKRMHPGKIDNIMQSIYERLDIESDDSNQFLSWAQVKALQASGTTIGSHTHNHAITTMVSEAEFIDEVTLSNQTIATQLGENPLHFAYPNGQKQDIAPFCEKVLIDAGYRSAVTTIEGDNRIGDNPFMLRRYNLSTERMQTPWGTPSRAMFTTLLSNPLRMH